MNDIEFANFFVRAMVDGGHMSGWFGDTSESFVQEQVQIWTSIFKQKGPVHINHVSSHASNLHHYADWTWVQVEEFIVRCGYVLFEYRSPCGKAWALARELPRAKELNQVQELFQHSEWQGIWKKEESHNESASVNKSIC